MNRAIMTVALIGAISSSIVGVSEVDAAVDMFMKIPGIDGEATNVNNPDQFGWIQIDSLQWGFTSGSGGTSARESSAPSVSEVSVTKIMDSTSTHIMKECCGPAKDVKIDLVSSSDETEVYHILLENAGLNSYSILAQGEGLETVTFTFTKISWNYENISDPAKNDSFEIEKKPGHR